MQVMMYLFLYAIVAYKIKAFTLYAINCTGLYIKIACNKGLLKYKIPRIFTLKIHATKMIENQPHCRII